VLAWRAPLEHDAGMMKTFPVGFLSLFLGASTLFAEDIASSLKGDLVALKGKRVHRLDDAAIANTKHFAVYFSAAWCGPCRQFTPDLVRWYNEFKPKHPEFELIFVSNDQDEKSMEAYMAEDQMAWPALKFSKIRTNKTLTKLSGRGIPCLAFIDAEGKVLAHSYEGENYVGPRQVMAEIEKMLGEGTAPAAEASAATATPRSAGKEPYKPSGSNFDDFFKKKQ
jgi:nucleoredoxin